MNPDGISGSCVSHLGQVECGKGYACVFPSLLLGEALCIQAHSERLLKNVMCDEIILSLSAQGCNEKLAKNKNTAPPYFSQQGM